LPRNRRGGAALPPSGSSDWLSDFARRRVDISPSPGMTLSLSSYISPARQTQRAICREYAHLRRLFDTLEADDDNGPSKGDERHD
jgi:hypothetical protein